MIELSLLICTRNGAKRLPAAFDAISAQVTSRTFEVILVDDGSNDSTWQLSQEFKNRAVFPVHLIHIEQQGISASRMAGIKSTSGKIVSFIDDDNIIEDQWVQRCCNFFDDPAYEHVGILGSLNTLKSSSPPPQWFTRCAAHYACGPQRNSSGPLPLTRPYLFGAGMTTRRELLIEAIQSPLHMSYFPYWGGEDSELCLRIAQHGWTLYYNESLHLEHAVSPERISRSQAAKLIKRNGKPMVILLAYFLRLKRLQWLYNPVTLLGYIILSWVVLPFRMITPCLRGKAPTLSPAYHTLGITEGFFICMPWLLKRCDSGSRPLRAALSIHRASE